jgi:glyoxylase-like metal-dependent hydrolase (beta-lactamase superfamily II)
MNNHGASINSGGSLGSSHGLKIVTGRVGDVEMARIYETTTTMNVKDWYPGLKRADLEPHLSWLTPQFLNLATGEFPMPIVSWVLHSMGQTILIDSCYGNDKDRPGYADAHHLNIPYLDRLEAAGVLPDQVDVVLCTHLHLDHVGWNTRLLNGRWVPTFPNARYLWSRVEREDAVSQSVAATTPPFLRPVYEDSVLPVLKAGLAQEIEGVFEVDDNILMRPAPGHSPGNVRIELRSQGSMAVFAGDILHSPIQIPLWRQASVVDADPALATRSRHELLSFCADEGALLIPGHFPDPYVGRIQRAGDSFVIRFGWS